MAVLSIRVAGDGETVSMRIPTATMKLLLLILVTAGMFHSSMTAAAGEESNVSTEVVNVIESGSYSDLLAFVRNAYTKSRASGNDAGAEYAYVFALNVAAPDKQIRLVIDFLLTESDFELNYRGAVTIVGMLQKGLTIDDAQHTEIVAKLKVRLAHAAAYAMKSCDFVREATKALVLMGDDDGLDIWLTSTSEVRNCSVVDRWDNESSDVRVPKPEDTIFCEDVRL